MTIEWQIFALILLAGATGALAMWFLMRAMGYARWDKYLSDERRKERYKTQERRVLWIKEWASNTMDTVPMNLRKEERQVLIKYKDLLNIWDKCDRIWFDLTY